MAVKHIPIATMKFRVRVVMTLVFFLLFLVVAVNFFHISVTENEKYQAMANDQHFGSILISAHRGSIYDSKGSTLAKSASVYKVFLDPRQFQKELKSLQESIDSRTKKKLDGDYKAEYDEDGNELNPLPESAEAFKNDAINFLSEKLGITTEEVSEAMEANNQYSRLKEQVEKPIADEVLAFFDQYELISLNVEEDTKRYYPHNELAASVIGFTSAGGEGMYGVEAYYDDYLAGVNGKTISAKDSNGNELPYRYSKTYSAKNGDDVYLTIDSEIQYTLEKHLEEMVTEFEVKNRACAILMNAKTGAIYGMATNPSFDLNHPYEVADPLAIERISKLTGDAKKQAVGNALEAQWKNKCITEIYEPGSVFKVITSSAAIEENLIDLANDNFYCSGSVTIPGAAPIHCHDWNGHGAQTFQEALTHSCNPAFMEIGSRLGIDKFCYYYEAFGLKEQTGIDLPAEGVGIGFEAENMSEVDLAVSAFGQGDTLTPIEMITSYCAAINGGYLLQPYVVDKIVDEDGNVVLKNERTVRRQVVSEETSEKVRTALGNVVTGSSGGNVSIKGYSIGGKSGTSERLSLDKDKYGASYVCFTPVEDPEIILLVLADMPNEDIGYYGSTVAVPTARHIFEDVLPYLGYYPEYTDEEVEELDVKIPLLEGSISDAKATLEGLGITYEIIGNGIEVVAQSPQTGSSVAKGGCVYLYTEKGNNIEYTTVPDLQYATPEVANETITYCQLNYVAKGASVKRNNAVVNSQSIPAGTRVPIGTTIELEFIVNENQD
ncbi:MAG: penicillin-binding transpeptidase domain-containing protein [Ruminococcus flavefaciens]|nr:penicillin-binding transpeptidase domain-containing protein [Ruminococcus flavefaciens]